MSQTSCINNELFAKIRIGYYISYAIWLYYGRLILSANNHGEINLCNGKKKLV